MSIHHDAAPSPALDLDQLGDEIAELSAHLEAATARLLALIREFDARGGWQGGFRSCADWLAWRVGLDPGAAREKVRVARALGGLPELAAALEHGEVSYSKVRAITRVATRDTEARLLAVARAGTASHVERVVRAWRHVDRQTEARETAQQHARRGLQVYPDDDGMFVIRGRLEPEAGALLLRALDAAREALYQQSRRPHPADTAAAPPPVGSAGTGAAVVHRAAGGPGRIESAPAGSAGSHAAPAESAAAGSAASSAPPASGSHPSVAAAAALPASDITFAQRQADGLALVAQSALAHALDPGSGSDRYQVVLHVDAPVLADPDQPGQAALEDGLRVSAETSRRLACDASRVVMRHGGERVGSFPGRSGAERTRAEAPSALGLQASAVQAPGVSGGGTAVDGMAGPLDVGRRTRTIPPALRRALVHRDQGCRFPGCSVRVCQGHHIRHWANGGATRLGNLTLLCHRHHRAVHEEGYQLDVGPDGGLRFRRPDGRVLPDVPPSPAVPPDPVGALTAHHRGLGLAIDPETSRPAWQGERLDVGWAIAVLHPAAQPAAGA